MDYTRHAERALGRRHSITQLLGTEQVYIYIYALRMAWHGRCQTSEKPFFRGDFWQARAAVVARVGSAVEIGGVQPRLEPTRQQHAPFGAAYGNIARARDRDLVFSRRLRRAGPPPPRLVVDLRQLHRGSCLGPGRHGKHWRRGGLGQSKHARCNVEHQLYPSSPAPQSSRGAVTRQGRHDCTA